MAYEWSRIPGVWMPGLRRATSMGLFSLDSAFVYEMSGDAWFVRWQSFLAQTSAALTPYVWCNSIVGSPTDVRAAVHAGAGAGEDKDRPDAGGSALATSAAIDFSAAALTWVATPIASISLAMNGTYYVVVDNRTATPASHYPVLATRGVLGLGDTSRLEIVKLCQAGETANGFTTDPGCQGYNAPTVLKFGDGSLLGNPYVSNVAHATNANDRGNRYMFTEDVVCSGVVMGGVSTAVQYIEINQASGGANVVRATVDVYGGQYGGASARFAPVTLSEGVEYDIVMTLSSTSSLGTIFYMGMASPPADVLACRIPNLIGHVDGATPGSYSLSTNKAMRMSLLIDDNPAQAGGGGIAKLAGDGGGLVG